MANLILKLGDLDRKIDKHEIVNIANENGQSVIDSKKYDLLKVYIELKRYEVYLKTLIEKIKEHAFVQATVHSTQNKNNRKTFLYANAKVAISTRTVWDFSSDKIWKELDDKIKELTEKKKEREKYLKEHSKPTTIVDEGTGAIIEQTDIPKEINQSLTIRL
jgi:hypothetical protein